MDRLVIDGISKTFNGVKALDKISFTVNSGEVLALCGENGAGKSTLMNIISGHLAADEGTISIDGKTLGFTGPKQSREAGISTVYQHLSLVNNLSVAENILTENIPTNRFGFINKEKSYAITQSILNQLNLSISPATIVSSLSPGEKQLVDIAKALSSTQRLLILDEPTASLADPEINKLFSIINDLKKNGVAIIYISHRLNEVFSIADRIAILKDGVCQGVFRRSALDKENLIRKMVGRAIPQLSMKTSTRNVRMLEIEKLSGQKFKSISFTADQGEVVGLAGLAGSGRTEIIRALFGLDSPSAGQLILKGKEVKITTPQQAIRHGLAFVSEDRRFDGVFPDISVQDNVLVSLFSQRHYWWNASRYRDDIINLTTSLQLKYNSIYQPVNQLSGGNQQKVVLAKWLTLSPDLLILDEPTHGVDVGAKYEIYQLVKEFASKGGAVILVSSELPELLSLCDTIHVIRNGALAGSLQSADASEEKIMSLATGTILNSR